LYGLGVGYPDFVANLSLILQRVAQLGGKKCHLSFQGKSAMLKFVFSGVT